MGNNQASKPQQKPLYTEHAKNTQNKQHIIPIKIRTNAEYNTTHEYDKRFKSTFTIYALYSKHEELGNVFTQMEKRIHHDQIFKPLKVNFRINDGFTAGIHPNDMNTAGKISIIAYDKRDIIKKGLSLRVTVATYKHKVINANISCLYMKQKNTNNPLICPFYHSVKQKYEFTKENLNHLNEYNHFKNEYEEKPQCKHSQDCKAYIRSENGTNRLDDNCHMRIYRHPPRTRNIKLSENTNPLIVNANLWDNHRVYEPTKADRKKHEYNIKDGFLKALIEEIINNQFQRHLCLDCGNDECKHEQYPILQMVDEKLNHNRHKIIGSPLRRDHMLALI
eukprot:166504_1